MLQMQFKIFKKKLEYQFKGRQAYYLNKEDEKFNVQIYQNFQVKKYYYTFVYIELILKV